MLEINTQVVKEGFSYVGLLVYKMAVKSYISSYQMSYKHSQFADYYTVQLCEVKDVYRRMMDILKNKAILTTFNKVMMYLYL